MPLLLTKPNSSSPLPRGWNGAARGESNMAVGFCGWVVIRWWILISLDLLWINLSQNKKIRSPRHLMRNEVSKRESRREAKVGQNRKYKHLTLDSNGRHVRTTNEHLACLTRRRLLNFTERSGRSGSIGSIDATTKPAGVLLVRTSMIVVEAPLHISQ